MNGLLFNVNLLRSIRPIVIMTGLEVKFVSLIMCLSSVVLNTVFICSSKIKGNMSGFKALC